MKKIIRTLIATGMSACLLAGCGGTGGAPESGQEPSGEGASASSQGEGTESGEDVSQESESGTAGQYPDYLNLDSYRPIVKEGEDITLRLAVKRDVIGNSDIEESWFVQFIEQELNINLEIEELTEENMEERKNLMLASDDLPDMMLSIGITNSEIVQYGVEGGMFLPMSDYFSEELTPYILQTLNEYEEAKTAYTTIDGKMYTLPVINAVRPGRPDTIGAERVFIDTKYLKAIGMEEAPKTLDGFVDMCRAFKELDPADLGVDEFYPILSTATLEDYLMTAFGWTGGAVDPVWDEAEQAIVVPCLQEKYGEYIKLMNTLYTEGLLHPDYYTMDETEERALMAERKCGVQADYAPYLSLETGWEDFIAASPLTSQWCDTPVSVKLPVYEDSYILISADTEYPELCMRLLDYIYTPEGSVYAEKGPAEGSPDTLGIVGGFVLTQDQSDVEYKEVLSGEYESTYAYACNKLRISSRINANRNYGELHAREMLGVEDPQPRELNLADPDDHYCYQVYTAQNQYLVDPLPTPYMTGEQSIRYTDLRTVINDYVKAETAKFVVGQRPIEELDQFFEELKGMNSEEYLALCQEIYANYTR